MDPAYPLYGRYYGSDSSRWIDIYQGVFREYYSEAEDEFVPTARFIGDVNVIMREFMKAAKKHRPVWKEDVGAGTITLLNDYAMEEEYVLLPQLFAAHHADLDESFCNSLMNVIETCAFNKKYPTSRSCGLEYSF